MLEKNILALDSPSPGTLIAFRRWFNSKAVPVFWGRDRVLFADATDLAALASVESDRLNGVLRRYCGWFLMVCCGPSYPDEGIEPLMLIVQRRARA